MYVENSKTKELPIGNNAPSRTSWRPQRSPRQERPDRYSRTDSTRVNGEIRAREVRVIDAAGEQLGIMPIREALVLAGEKELDLVEVAPNADPPVCRLMDFGKYLYEKQKRERESRKAHKQIEVKEVQMGPKTDEHDIQVVLNKIRKFAKDGAKIRVRVKFKGREIYHPEVAQELLQRVANDVAADASVESMPAFDGKSLIMILVPAR
jgi:translation initiation factor IF-3